MFLVPEVAIYYQLGLGHLPLLPSSPCCEQPSYQSGSRSLTGTYLGHSQSPLDMLATLIYSHRHTVDNCNKHQTGTAV